MADGNIRRDFSQVCRILLDAVGIANFSVDYAINHLKIMLGAPEAATGEEDYS